MSDMQWQVGKSYRLKDVEGFTSQGYLLSDNVKIANTLGTNPFTVCGVDDGKVFSIGGYDPDDLEIFRWFNAEDIEYFELVEDAVTTAQKQPVCPVYSYPVHEWLMKLGYVVATDHTITGLMVKQESKEVFICTEYGDITGVSEVVDYINTNYEMLKISENTKRKAELEAKRLKVLQELSDIDSELGRY